MDYTMYLVAGFCTVVGIICVGGGLVAVRMAKEFVRTARHYIGIITGYEVVRGRRGGQTLNAVVSYKDDEGNVRTVKSSYIRVDKETMYIGANLPILYDPQHPALTRIDHPDEVFAPQAGFIIGGVCMIIIGVFLFLYPDLII